MASTTPIIGRISRPVVAGTLPRKRLYRRIDEGRKRSVVWVAGPPGAGKTTLVSSYVDARKVPCLWYQADRTDADPVAFFQYLALAARRIVPGRGISLAGPGPGDRSTVHAFAERFFDALYESLPPKTVLVIENYHRIPADSPLHEMVRDGLYRMPPGLSAVLVSRTVPPAPYAKLRADRRMEIIPWSELRLTPEEAKRIARLNGYGSRHGAFPLQAARKARGWVAGLILLLLAPSVAAGIPTGTSWDNPENLFEVFHYFAEEVFEAIDPEDRKFLMRSAFFPRMTGGMAKRLTGNPLAHRILQHMARQGLFTEVHPAPDPVYEYHSLFRRFLLACAERTYSPEENLRLRGRAAAILEDAGQSEDAADLHGEAGDAVALSRLVRAHARALVGRGRVKTLQKWLDLLPAKTRDEDPWLQYWEGVCRLPRNPGESRPLFERAFRKFEALGEEEETLHSWAGAVDSILLERDHFHRLDPWIDWMEERLRRTPGFPSPPVEARVAGSMAGALAWRRPRPPQAEGWVERALSLRQHKENPNLGMQAVLHAGNYYLWTGQWGKIDLLLDEIRDRMNPRETYVPMLLFARWLGAARRVYSGEALEECLGTVEDCLKLSERTGIRAVDGILSGLGTHASLLLGQDERASRHLARMGATFTPQSRSGGAWYHYLSAWMHLSRGETRQALRHAETSLALEREGGRVFPAILARAGLAQALHEHGERERARRELEEALAAAREAGSALLEFECLLTMAGFRLDAGDDSGAVGALGQAMALGRDRQFFGLAGWWRPKRMGLLCGKALEAGIETEWVKALVRRRGLLPDAPLVEAEDWPWTVRVYTFGRFGLVREGETVQFSRKSPQKPILMLKVLIALGGRDVSEQEVTEHLWPEADGDRAHESFAVTLRRLRRLLGSEEAVRLSEGRLTLNNRLCWVDTWALERILGRIERLWGDGGDPAAGGECSRLAEKAMALYKGPFLEGESFCACLDSHRERLRSKFLRCILVAGRHWEGAGQWERAVACYQKGLEIDNLAEEFCQRLICCYKRMGRPADACALFHRCKKTLQDVLGVPPSPRTVELLKSPDPA